MKKLLTLMVLVALAVTISFIGISCKQDDTSAVTEETAEEVKEEAATEEEAVVEEVAEEEDKLPEITDEPITLYLTCIASPSGDKWRKWIDFYMEDHPNVTIEFSTFDWTTLSDISESMLASGSEDLDILWTFGGGTLNKWARDGLIRNLDDLYEMYGWEDRIISAAQNYKTPDLGWYHVQDGGVLTPLVYYNKSILEEVGVEVPSTIEELFDISGAINDAGYTTYLNAWGTQTFRLFNILLLRSMGQAEYDKLLLWGEDSNRSAETAEIFKSQAVVDAYQLLLDMKTKGLLNEGFAGMDNTASLTMFTEGKAAFYDWGVWATKMIRDAAPDMDLGYIPFPASSAGGETPFTINFANGVCIPAYVSDEKVAVIADLLNEAHSKKYALETITTEGIVTTTTEFTAEELADVMDPINVQIVNDLATLGGTFLVDHWAPASLKAEHIEIADLVANEVMTPEEAAQALYEAAILTLDE